MPRAVDFDPFADEAPTGGKPVDFDPFEEEPKYDLGKDLKRQLGLTVRHGITGLTGLATLAGDAANSVLNLPIAGANKAFGTKIPTFQMPSDVTQNAMTALGVPQPEGVLERLIGVGSSALSGAGGARAAAEIPQMPAALRSTLSTLGDAPKLQAVGAATGALGVEGAQEAGVENPLALLAIGSVAGMAPGSSATTLSRLAGGAKQAAAPFTVKGKERLVGDLWNRLSTTPTATAERLGRAREIVPGSSPMSHEVSQDPGLINAFSAVRGMDDTGRIPQRLSDQNRARQNEFERIARDEDTLAYATNKRDQTYDQFAAPAFENAGKAGAGVFPALQKVDEVLKSKKGIRAIVQQAMDESRTRLESLRKNGRHDPTDPANLYEVRKDLADLRDGKYNTEKSDFRLAKGEIAEVIKSLDEVIEGAAPGYQKYLDVYRKRSIPLDQLGALQDVRKRAALAAPDPLSGDQVLSQAKFTTLLRNNLDDGLNLRGKGVGDAKLSSQQLRTLDRIAADLDRGASATSGTMRVPGSDTFKNLSVAAVIGRVLGDKAGEAVMSSSAGKSIAAPLSFLYRMPDRDVQMLMLETWLDPQLQGRLMRQASRAEIESIANELGRRAAQQSAANALYGSE